KTFQIFLKLISHYDHRSCPLIITVKLQIKIRKNDFPPHIKIHLGFIPYLLEFSHSPLQLADGIFCHFELPAEPLAVQIGIKTAVVFYFVNRYRIAVNDDRIKLCNGISRLHVYIPKNNQCRSEEHTS